LVKRKPIAIPAQPLRAGAREVAPAAGAGDAGATDAAGAGTEDAGAAGEAGGAGATGLGRNRGPFCPQPASSPAPHNSSDADKPWRRMHETPIRIIP
jgi:hypothetical protein